MSDRDFSIGDMRFKLNKIDVFKQFHIARRLSPIMSEIIAVAPKIKGLKEDLAESEKLDAIAQLAKPIMDGFSKLSDQDANFVLMNLCSAVEVQQASNWSRISNGEVLMFNTFELPTLLQIAGRSFMYNIAGFFTIAPQTFHGGK